MRYRSLFRCCLAGGASIGVLANPAGAGEKPVESLPAEWRMESDEAYSYHVDYAAPTPVTGLVAHGYSADDSIWAEDGVISIRPPKNCAGPIRFTDERDIPQEFPARTTGEYWFYRSGNQAVYLSRKWVYEVDSSCQGIAREVSRIVRVVWFNGRTTFIEQTDGRATGMSAHTVDDFGYHPIPHWLVRIDDSDLRKEGQDRLLRTSRKNESGAKRTCFDHSITFHFATRCYYSGRGPWRGFLLSFDMQDDTGHNYSEIRTVKFDPKARIDGRLFEWDRKIERNSEAS